MIPTAGWLSTRFGRKRVFLCAVAGFTFASVLCGAANSRTAEVLARIAQGMSGAFLIPLSHAIILDTCPQEQHGKAMALWGAGSVFGSVIGPTIDGYLTEYWSWRYIFYVNVPFGLIALLGVLAFVPDTQRDPNRRLDWFESEEIILLACAAALGIYLFVVHSLTRPAPFLNTRLLTQRSFAVSLMLISFYGFLTLPPMVLMPAFLENLRGYSIDSVGVLQSPRGIGLLAALIVSSRIAGKIDPRILIAVGFSLLAVSCWEMSSWTAEVGTWPVVWTGLVQSVGAGILLVPIQMIAFPTLAPQLRTEAAAVFNLVRSVFSSVGVSIALTLFVVASTEGHARLVEYVSPYAQGLRFAAKSNGVNAGTEHGLAMIEQEIQLQAAMLGYNRIFLFIAVASLIALPLLLLIGRRSTSVSGSDHDPAADTDAVIAAE